MITIEELDSCVKDLVSFRKIYEEAKHESDSKHQIFEEQKQRVIEMLAEAGKTSYRVDGIANITLSVKKKVKTPKDLESKKAFFEWLEATQGIDSLLTYQTINYNSLNSLYNSALEASGKDSIDVPGLEQPENEAVLSIRKA